MDRSQRTVTLTLMDMQAVMESLRAMAHRTMTRVGDAGQGSVDAAYWEGYNHAVFEIANHVLLPADHGDIEWPVQALPTEEPRAS